jgi:hypothetical protein
MKKQHQVNVKLNAVKYIKINIYIFKMSPPKKIEDSLRQTMDKLHMKITEEAKSSLVILRKTRNDFEVSENYNPETEDKSSIAMYKQQLIIFISILAYDWDKIVLAMQTFLDIASKLMPNLPEPAKQSLEITAQQYIKLHSSDQFKLVMGVAQIQVEDEFFCFKKGQFVKCEEMKQAVLGDTPIEIVIPRE